MTEVVITKNQRRFCLKWIDLKNENGLSPTQMEIGEALGYLSPSSAAGQYIQTLVKKGGCSSDNCKARSTHLTQFGWKLLGLAEEYIRNKKETPKKLSKSDHDLLELFSKLSPQHRNSTRLIINELIKCQS